jgi:hypothetical protein
MTDIINRYTKAVIYTGLPDEELRATVARAVQDRANLREANLRGANLSGADLSGADLRGADLSGADLSGADLSEAYLSGANLRGADLSGADLRGADLSEAYLSEADLRGANLRGADLSGADLRGAYLSEAYLSEADLRGADLSGADLSGAKNFRFQDAPDPLALRRSVADHIEQHPELHDQAEWGDGSADHACETPCCVAGWACHLGGGARGTHVASAATRLLWVDGLPMPPFDATATREEILAALRAELPTETP